MEKWKLLISGSGEPSLNMGIDYFLWEKTGDENFPPVLRFYTWKVPSVSTGYNQSPEKLININFCLENKFPMVRRPTGGSVIFHDLELTYSFCANCKYYKDFSSPFKSYILICKGIIKGMEKMGLRPEIRGVSEGKEPSYTTRDCFSLSSKHDITFEGKKIVGSAQRRNRKSFLQHGSILIDIRKNLWENIFLHKPDFSKVGSLKEFGVEVGKEKLIEFLKTGFEEVFEIEFELMEISEKEMEECKKLAENFLIKKERLENNQI